MVMATDGSGGVVGVVGVEFQDNICLTYSFTVNTPPVGFIIHIILPLIFQDAYIQFAIQP